jgi:hypothetical protein
LDKQPKPDELVVVSKTQQIEQEIRFWIANKQVITGSQYKLQDSVELERFDHRHPQEALQLAQKIAQEEWEPEKLYTIDVCLSNNQWKLLEINSFSCSGIYDCDPNQIAQAIKNH